MQTLKTVRFFKEVTQMKLALWTGINQAKISQFENFLVMPTSKEKQLISKALGCKVGDIIWAK